jgi:hypothetical protein
VLANQFADGRLADPGLALRWLIAGALVAGLAALRRSGRSVWSGKGIAIWLLAALLHGPAVAASGDQSGVLALPEAVVTVVVQVAASAGALALGLWVLGSLLGAAIQRSLLPLAARTSAARMRTAPDRRPFSPRPPPRF